MLAARGARLLARALLRNGAPALSSTPAVFVRHMAGRGTGASSADSSFTLGDASSDEEARRSAAAAAASPSANTADVAAQSASAAAPVVEERGSGSGSGSGSDDYNSGSGMSSGSESFDDDEADMTPEQLAARREQQLREIKQLQAELDEMDNERTDTDDGVLKQKRVRLAVGPATGSVRRVDAATLLGREPSDVEDESARPRSSARGGTGGGLDSDDEIVDVDVETLSERLDHDPALRRRGYKQALYQRRNTRTHVAGESDAMDDFAAAFAREHAHEIELTDPEDITRPTDYAKGTGQDPLERMGPCMPFFLGAVCWTTSLSLDAAPESRKQDRRVRMETHIPTLLPDDKTTAAYVRAIAGAHYRSKTDKLIISCDKHVDAGMNRRVILEKLVSLVSEAQRLGREYGPFPRVKKLPQYSH